MDPSPPDLRAIFEAVLEHPEGRGRDVALDEACRGDASLRARVEALLHAHGAAAGFLAGAPTAAPAEGATADAIAVQGDDPSPASAAPEGDHTAPGAGGRVGPYRLLQAIGEGGMGTVYMAEQQRPVRRRVALKVIKAGMDSAQVIARFEAERQALALMDHPGIAKVLDAGATEAGRPYFVMELIKGVPITQYCDEARLTPTQRLELFVPVCEAVQHAHQKGVIHRDLKPSNILVTLVDGRPVPKVIDFGVAKATDQRLTERTMFTQFGALVGTPEYMSPEQAEISALDVDTRSDVYSLGVLLYELLTGTTPLDRETLRQAGFAAILRRIREEEPPKPSTRLSASGDRLASLSAVRGVEPARLAKLVRGDLDWIVMKALEKDRSRRYDSATGFARDVRRYLDGDAIEARPPSTRYKLGKLARKHGAALATASAFLLLLIGATVLSTALAISASRARARSESARQEADAARKEAEATSRLLIDVFRRPDPRKQGALLRASELLDLTVEGVKADASFPAPIRAKVLADLEPARRAMAGSSARAGDLMTGAIAGLKGDVAIAPRVKGELLHVLGLTCFHLGLFDRSLDALEEAERIESAVLAMDDPVLLAIRADLLDEGLPIDYTPERRAFGLETVRRCERSLGLDDPITIRARNKFACFLWAQGQLEGMIPFAEETLRRAEGRFAPGDEPLTRARITLACHLARAGRVEDAYALSRRNLDATVAALGPDHYDSIISRNNLAYCAEVSGRVAEQVEAIEQGVEIKGRILGEDHRESLGSRRALAAIYLRAGRREEGLALLRRVLDRTEELYGPDLQSALVRLSLAAELVTGAECEEAIPEIRALLEGEPPGISESQRYELRYQVLNRLVDVQGWAGQYQDAEANARALVALTERRVREHPGDLQIKRDAMIARVILGDNLGNTLQISEARALLQEVIAEAERHPALKDQGADARNLLAFHEMIERPASSRDRFETVRADLESKGMPKGNPVRVSAQLYLAECHFRLGDHERAEALWGDAQPLLSGYVAEFFERRGSRSDLGAILMARGDFAAAEPLVLAGYRGMKEREAYLFPIVRALLPDRARRVVELYERWGKPEEADRWRRELGMPARELPFDVFATSRPEEAAP